jgi:hypothetical protein
MCAGGDLDEEFWQGRITTHEPAWLRLTSRWLVIQMSWLSSTCVNSTQKNASLSLLVRIVDCKLGKVMAKKTIH